MRRSTIFTFMSVGIASTAIATYVLAATIGGTRQYYFQEYFSPTIILASVMLFLLLNTNQRTSTSGANSVSQLKSSELGSKLLKLISENTLPIFLFHVMVLESLQRGYFGFAINGSTINSIVGIPLITVITLFICLAVIIPLKKIPILKRLIG
jgi:surface polysaccharide O-acyltransferase-like enzyme